ncbi:hypothetical protein [Jiella sp. M17.18]|uniref:hypothetical protein n=1 Tax=Jiella sp. M17.18 TaxID=3234247 RepID=UPI0034DF3CEF
MLQLTPETLTYLRTAQRQAEALERQRKAMKVKKERRKLGHKVFLRLVETTVAILRTGEPTRFEFEGSCRHGIRRSLILEEWSWADADHAAAEVVAKALNQIGAVRPTLIEGQPEYAANFSIERHWCAREKCGKIIPEERRLHWRTKYCSDLCSDAAYHAFASLSGERRSAAEWLAECARRSAQSVRERTLNCEYEPCGRPFIGARYDSRFCSYSCANRAATKLPETACANPDCGKQFKPTMVQARGKAEPQPQKYCSRACAGAVRRGNRSTSRTCANPPCGANFHVRFPSDPNIYCSPYCVQEGRKLKKRSAFRCEPVSEPQEWDFDKKEGR